MDDEWMALALIIPLAVGLVCVIWSFIASCARRRRRCRGPVRGHLFRGQGEAIMVAELLADAVERGDGIRLNWPEDDLYFSPIRPDEQGQFPTEILPRIDDPGSE